ncbi:MAG TPA: hypothetical protein VEJ47_20705 [Candidatus Eremiobacteraceae bacterium]|nr:hypothetical protein [Candidatus Eremiobacteraceae bacterium]
MKLNLSSFFLLGAAALLFGSAAQAQTVNLRAQIPFDFVVGDKVYPAGEYAVKTTGVHSYMLSIANRNIDKSGLTLPYLITSGKPAEHSALFFRRIGDAYVLSQLWAEGNCVGLEFPHSRVEIRLAMNSSKPETFIVAANIVQ